MSGGVVLYAAQSNVQIDAEIAKKDRFQTKTNLACHSNNRKVPVKMRVLIFDDDADIRNLLQAALSSKGHEVTTFNDPTEFPFYDTVACPCSLIESCADILITDIVMPNIEGIEFLKKLKDSGCRPMTTGNVAIISGYLTIHYMNELNNLDIHYFRKPFELSDIYEWVDQCQKRLEGPVTCD